MKKKIEIRFTTAAFNRRAAILAGAKPSALESRFCELMNIGIKFECQKTTYMVEYSLATELIELGYAEYAETTVQTPHSEPKKETQPEFVSVVITTEGYDVYTKSLTGWWYSNLETKMAAIISALGPVSNCCQIEKALAEKLVKAGYVRLTSAIIDTIHSEHGKIWEEKKSPEKNDNDELVSISLTPKAHMLYKQYLSGSPFTTSLQGDLIGLMKSHEGFFICDIKKSLATELEKEGYAHIVGGCISFTIRSSEPDKPQFPFIGTHKEIKPDPNLEQFQVKPFPKCLLPPLNSTHKIKKQQTNYVIQYPFLNNGGVMDNATVNLVIDFAANDFSITPKSQSFFIFKNIKKSSSRSKAVLKAIETAIDFARNELEEFNRNQK